MSLTRSNRPYRLLVLGANGVFGRRTVHRLSRCPNLEVLAGCRTRAKAEALAREMGNNVKPVWGDLREWKELQALADGIDGIFHCAGPFSNQPLNPLEIAIERGLDYADLGDDPTYLRSAEERLAHTDPPGRIVIPGASSLPSMTSFLVKIAESRFGSVDSVEVNLFIGNRNPKGRGAISYLMNSLRTPYQALRGGKKVLKRSWEKLSFEKSPFEASAAPFSLIESPDDYFLPSWFNVKDVSFRVSLEFGWIHRVISGIKAMQPMLPRAFDQFWLNTLFFGHPMMRGLGTKKGWLQVTARKDGRPKPFVQRYVALDEGQKIPSFPMCLIGRILAGEVEGAARSGTRLTDIISVDQFLVELKKEGVLYESR